MSTSINTAFGSHIRKALESCGLSESIDSRSNTIIFIDSITGQRTGCILKSGSNSVNSDDKTGIHDKLNNIPDVKNRLVAVIYGIRNEINSTYERLEREFEVLVGNEFWHRITGFPNFYEHLQQAITAYIANWDTGNHFQTGLRILTGKVGNNYLF